jgi:hypothetical protein
LPAQYFADILPTAQEIKNACQFKIPVIEDGLANFPPHAPIGSIDGNFNLFHR